MDFKQCVSILAKREPEHHHEMKGNDLAGSVEEEICSVDEFLNTISSCSTFELIQHVFEFQEQRVAVYREFETNFFKYQATKEFETFSSKVSSQFKDISAKINAIETKLKPNYAAKLIRKLQTAEQEKLLLTSSILVEKMRRDHELQQNPESEQIYIQTLASLEKQHSLIIQDIHNTLEELRYEQ